jgi:hypothetical protein
LATLLAGVIGTGSVVLVGGGGGALSAVARAASGTAAGQYRPVTATAIIDTRNGLGGISGPILGGTTTTFSPLGRAGVPSTGVLAVAVNITTTGSSEDSYLTAWQADEPRPALTTLSSASEYSVNNLAIVPVSAAGEVSIYYRAGSTHLVVSVVGYVTEADATTGGATYAPLSSVRILDTRDGTGAGIGLVAADSITDVQVAGRGGVPASGATAIAVNLGSTSASTNGYLTAWPSGTTRPNTSSMNVAGGDSTQKLVIVPLGANGKISIFNRLAATHLFGDVMGYFKDPATAGSGDTFVPVTAARIMDSRNGTGGRSTPLVGGSSYALQVTGVAGIPRTGADAVAVSITATNSSIDGYLVAYSNGLPRPTGVSTLDTTPAQNVTNLALVQPGADGKIALYNNAGTTDIVIDVVGYFTYSFDAPSTAAPALASPSLLGVVTDSRTGTPYTGPFNPPSAPFPPTLTVPTPLSTSRCGWTATTNLCL